MSKTSSINKIIQQLGTLSLEQLLEVREKVNALIEEKAPDSKLYKTLDFKYSLVRTGVVGQAGAGISETLANLLGSSSSERNYLVVARGDHFSLEDVDAEDETLDDAIKLVEEWMSDESGYDEETYPQIESALNQNRLSL